MYDTSATLSSTQDLAVWKNYGTKVAVLDGSGKFYANTYVYKYIIGDTVLISHDTEANTENTSYIKLKTITLGANVGKNATLRIKFDLRNSIFGPIAYGRIYRNGVAIGTEGSNPLDSYETCSEDIAGWYAGDTIELWVHAYSECTAYVRNFRVCGSHTTGIVNEVTGSTS
jgi:hypothetical protein